MLTNTDLFQVAGSVSTYSFIISLQSKHYFWHIMKEKLGSDVGQPGTFTGDTRLTHASPKGDTSEAVLSPHCYTPVYRQTTNTEYSVVRVCSLSDELC